MFLGSSFAAVGQALLSWWRWSWEGTKLAGASMDADPVLHPKEGFRMEVRAELNWRALVALLRGFTGQVYLASLWS